MPKFTKRYQFTNESGDRTVNDLHIQFDRLNVELTYFDTFWSGRTEYVPSPPNNELPRTEVNLDMSAETDTVADGHRVIVTVSFESDDTTTIKGRWWWSKNNRQVGERKSLPVR